MVLVREYDDLGAVAHVKLQENPFDVGFHRSLADEQFFCNIGVCVAVSHQQKDFAFASGELFDDSGIGDRKDSAPGAAAAGRLGWAQA
jgi:hypothetical protein